MLLLQPLPTPTNPSYTEILLPPLIMHFFLEECYLKGFHYFKSLKNTILVYVMFKGNTS